MHYKPNNIIIHCLNACICTFNAYIICQRHYFYCFGSMKSSFLIKFLWVIFFMFSDFIRSSNMVKPLKEMFWFKKVFYVNNIFVELYFLEITYEISYILEKSSSKFNFLLKRKKSSVNLFKGYKIEFVHSVVLSSMFLHVPEHQSQLTLVIVIIGL